MHNIRNAILAGTWYEDSADKLRRRIERELDESNQKSDAVAVVAPHAGHLYSGKVAAKAVAALKECERIFILCPNHRAPLDGIAATTYAGFEIPLGTFAVDTLFPEAGANSGRQIPLRVFDYPHRYEHAVEVLLPYLFVKYENSASDAMPLIVPLIVGNIDDAHADALATFLKSQTREGDVFVFSSDLVHWGEAYDYRPFEAHSFDDLQHKLEVYDNKTLSALCSLNPEIWSDYLAENSGHVACGHNTFKILTRLFAGCDARVLDYTNSSRLTGNADMSVSYAAVAVNQI